MDEEMKWGDPVPHEGRKPDWLAGDTPVQYRGWDWHEGQTAEWWGWVGDGEYRLPANHAYYLATSKGFTYWPGGDSAPDDWDGGEAIARNGRQVLYPQYWQHMPYHEFSGEWDVIGYRKANASYAANITTDGRIIMDAAPEPAKSTGEHTVFVTPGQVRKRTYKRAFVDMGEACEPVSGCPDEDTPQWAIDRALDEIGSDALRRCWAGSKGRASMPLMAFARYIGQHEQPPVDPDLIEAREVVCGYHHDKHPESPWHIEQAEIVRSGRFDNMLDVQAAYHGIKRGRALAAINNP